MYRVGVGYDSHELSLAGARELLLGFRTGRRRGRGSLIADGEKSRGGRSLLGVSMTA